MSTKFQYLLSLSSSDFDGEARRLLGCGRYDAELEINNSRKHVIKQIEKNSAGRGKSPNPHQLKSVIQTDGKTAGAGPD